MNVLSSASGLVSIGDMATIDFNWSGLDAGDIYMGAIVHDDAGGDPLGYTVVTIDTGF